MPRLTVNGEAREVPPGTTLIGLLDLLGVMPERLVVELNRKVLSPETYPVTALAEDDVVELVRFVGGG